MIEILVNTYNTVQILEALISQFSWDSDQNWLLLQGQIPPIYS